MPLLDGTASFPAQLWRQITAGPGGGGGPAVRLVLTTDPTAPNDYRALFRSAFGLALLQW